MPLQEFGSPGGFVGVAVGVGVTVGVPVGVAVGEPVGVGVGVPPNVKVSAVHAFGVSAAFGLLVGTFGATACCLNW